MWAKEWVTMMIISLYCTALMYWSPTKSLPCNGPRMLGLLCSPDSGVNRFSEGKRPGHTGNWQSQKSNSSP